MNYVPQLMYKPFHRELLQPAKLRNPDEKQCHWPARRKTVEKTCPSHELSPCSLPAPDQGRQGGEDIIHRTFRMPIPIQILVSDTHPSMITRLSMVPASALSRKQSGLITSQPCALTNAPAISLSLSTITKGSMPKWRDAYVHPPIPANNSATWPGPRVEAGCRRRQPFFSKGIDKWITPLCHNTWKLTAVALEVLATCSSQIKGTLRNASFPQRSLYLKVPGSMRFRMSNFITSPEKTSMGSKEAEGPQDQMGLFVVTPTDRLGGAPRIWTVRLRKDGRKISTD